MENKFYEWLHKELKKMAFELQDNHLIDEDINAYDYVKKLYNEHSGKLNDLIDEFACLYSDCKEACERILNSQAIINQALEYDIRAWWEVIQNRLEVKRWEKNI